MNFSSDTPSPDFLSALHAVCNPKNIELGSVLNESYGRDEATKRNYTFDYLVKPVSALEIAEIVKICNHYNIPITPRGGGSSVSGGASPVNGGLVLSTENLNKIIEINTLDKIVVVECGVVTEHLCKKVEEKNLYFPIRPSSAAISFVGGNVAHNSGSINSLKYGSAKDYVLNLEVVLPNGEIIWTGANTSKNSSGLNLTQLFVGSEGILGIITKVVLKLIPKPKYEYTLAAEFGDLKALCHAVLSITESGISPSAIEIIDEFAVNLTADFLAAKMPVGLSGNKALLLVNFDGNSPALLDEVLENCYELIKDLMSGDVLIGKTPTQKEELWKIRMNIGGALMQGSKVYRDVDIAVPVSKLLAFMESVKSISEHQRVNIACFGHAGNGNLHTMISVDKSSDLEAKYVIEAIDQIYKIGIEMGGTISGEHGIGMLQKKYMPLQYSESYLNLSKAIKKVLDPKNLINPGKIV